MQKEKEFQIPSDLNNDGKKAAQVILTFLVTNNLDHAGGQKVFYSPQEWADRGEEYGLESVLIVVHDGGDHAGYFNLDYCCYDAVDQMDKLLNSNGFFMQQCTGWYTAIYKR